MTLYHNLLSVLEYLTGCIWVLRDCWTSVHLNRVCLTKVFQRCSWMTDLQETPVRWPLKKCLSGEWKCDRMTSVPACAVFGYFAPVYTAREQRGWQNRRRLRLLTQQSVGPLTSVASGGFSCRCIKTRRPAAMLATVSKEGENILSVEYNGTMFRRICLICLM